jgi:hypothetical protein
LVIAVFLCALQPPAQGSQRAMLKGLHCLLASAHLVSGFRNGKLA